MSGDVEGEVIGFLLQTLKGVVTEYINLKIGAESEFEKLVDELHLLENFLKDSDKMSGWPDFYKEKVRQIREVFHDVEDTIEICMTKKAAAKTKFVTTRLLQKLGTGMARQVKNLRLDKVTPIVKAITDKFGPLQYSLGESSISSEKLDAQRIPVNQDELVDFRDEEIIIRYLQESKAKLDVISITGMAGLGKTTFASKIFQHETIVSEFPLRVWNRVSQGFDIRDVLLKIINTMAPKHFLFSPDYEELSLVVKGCLEDKKFLLVMDDVWTEDDWLKIREHLPLSNGKGKVLVTTRDRSVAIKTNISREPHQLLELEATESLRLLKLKVFMNDPEQCTPDLADVMEKIANKCIGVPLVILLIGGILKEGFVLSRSPVALKKDWERVLENMDVILKQDEKNVISNFLEMSYKSLTHDLKLCFLYMGLFPENHEIPASVLSKLWIAEGFIQPRERQSIEDSATEILNKLINKNLLMVEKKNLEHIKTCRVHYMIRAFCLSKAMEVNIFRVIGHPGHKLSDEQVKQLRRLCLHSINPSTFLTDNPNGPRVRSFHCFFKEPLQLDPTPVSFSLLRVLNCNSIKFEVFPEIKRLILLKHISLCINQINALPKHIYKLVNLQTLIVETTSPTIIVKKEIWKLPQLRRFKTTSAISLDDTKGEGKACVSLETMSKLSPDSCNVALSKRAPNLKTLGIRGKLANLFVTFSMTDFSTLEKLKLENDLGNESAASSNHSTKMPKMLPALSDNSLYLTQTECFPPNLTKLSLSKTRLKWADHMKILAKIKTLKVLKLKDDALTGNRWQVGQHNVFPELNLLVIENTDLEDWEDLTPLSFPKLRSLRVKNCRLLKAIPGNLAYLDYLETLEIEHVKRSVADSAKAIDSFRKQPKDAFRVPFQLIIGPGCTIP